MSQGQSQLPNKMLRDMQLRRLSDNTQRVYESPVPVLADESARTPAEALGLLRAGAASGVNIKVAKTGLSPSVHLACGTGAFRWIDLDSDVLLAEPRPEGRYQRAGPKISVSHSGR